MQFQLYRVIIVSSMMTSGTPHSGSQGELLVDNNAKENNSKFAPVLVTKDKSTKSVWGDVVHQKGL